MAEKLPGVLRVADLIDRYKIGRSTLHRWIESGEFPRPLRLPGKQPVWREDTIDEWERSREATQARA